MGGCKNPVKNWFVKTECLKVMILHFLEIFRLECMLSFCKLKVHTHANVKE